MTLEQRAEKIEAYLRELGCLGCPTESGADKDLGAIARELAALMESEALPVIALVSESLDKAVAKHAPMRGPHEGYSVILEELDELWAEIKSQKPDKEKMLKEALHVAAMGARFAMDVCYPDTPKELPMNNREGHTPWDNLNSATLNEREEILTRKLQAAEKALEPFANMQPPKYATPEYVTLAGAGWSGGKMIPWQTVLDARVALAEIRKE